MYVNKQNCRISGSENPQIIKERPLHPEKITVWSGGGIGPYFFYLKHYAHMKDDFFSPAIEE